MKHIFLTTGTLIAIFFASTVASPAQASMSDEPNRGDGMKNFKEKILVATQALVDQIDAWIDEVTLERKLAESDSDLCPSSLSLIEDAGEDSLRKHTGLRQEQNEIRRELEALKLKAQEMERAIQNKTSEGDEKVEKNLKRLTLDMEKLQKRLDRLQKRTEHMRRDLEDRYITNGQDVIRVNDDYVVEQGDTLHGDIVLTNGDLTVRGAIKGKALVTNGDILLENQGVVEGDAVAINGDIVVRDSARVLGRFIEHHDVTDADDLDEEELAFNNFYIKYPSSVSTLFPLRSPFEDSFLRYNRVEGLYLGFAHPKKIYWLSRPEIVGTGSLGYGFASHTWRYSLGLYKPMYFDNHIIELGAEGHSLTDSKDHWVVGRDENSVTAFLAREDFMDYFERRGYSISLEWSARYDNAIQTRLTTAYRHDTYRSMDKATDWSVFGGDKTFRENPAVSDGNINSVAVTAGVSTVVKIAKQMAGWDFLTSYEVAGGTTKGDYNFYQIIADLRRYQPLFGFMNLNGRIRAAASNGEIPVQRSFDLGGISTLPGYRYKEFSGSHVALANVELIIMNPIDGNSKGWAKWALDGINLILFSDFGVTNTPTYSRFRDQAPVSMNASFDEGITSLKNNQVKSDIGFALGSSDGDFRIGMAWRLDKSSSPNFILRFTRPF